MHGAAGPPGVPLEVRSPLCIGGHRIRQLCIASHPGVLTRAVNCCSASQPRFVSAVGPTPRRHGWPARLAALWFLASQAASSLTLARWRRDGLPRGRWRQGQGATAPGGEGCL